MSRVDDMVKFGSRARVTLTVEIDLSDTWGGDCTVAQIQKQAAESALGQVRRGIASEGLHGRIVGEPRVEAIMVERGRA